MSALLELRAAAALIGGYLGPAAELLASALDGAPSGRAVAVGHFAVVLDGMLRQRHPALTPVMVEAMPPPLLRQLGVSRSAVYGAAYPLPMGTASAAMITQALSFSDHTTDTTVIREAARVLQPGGVFLGAFLMRGSFQAYFDAAKAVCELDGLTDLLQAVRELETQFRLPDTLKGMASRAGLVDVECGLEERVLGFDTPEAFLTDAGVRNVLLRRLGGSAADVRHQLQDRVQSALTDEFHGKALMIRLVTGVLRGVKPRTA